MNGQVRSKPTQRRYSRELKERAVPTVLQLREETGERHGSVRRVADQPTAPLQRRLTRGRVRPRR